MVLWNDADQDSKKVAHTYLSSCAFVIQGAKGNSRQQNGNVEENSGGSVL